MHFTSARPSRHFAIGVVQYQIFFAYSASPAWYEAQSSRKSQAFSLEGASPKNAVAWALAFGLEM